MKKIAALLLLTLLCAVSFAADGFLPEFSTAGFYSLPETGRDVWSMNIAWRFHKGDVEGEPYSLSFDDSGWECVSLPNGIEYLPANASGSGNYQGIVWYRKHFTPEESMKGKKLFLHFEAIMGKSKVWVNGRQLAEHFGGYLPVIVDVSDELEWGRDNVITVMADNSNDPSFPVGRPQEKLDFCYFGGIYRDCWLIAHNDIYITDPNYEDEVAGGGLHITFDDVSEKSAEVNVRAHVCNESARNSAVAVICVLNRPDGTEVARRESRVSLKKGEAGYASVSIPVSSPELWSPETPYLYNMDVYLKKGDRILDGQRRRIGIRSVEFRQNDGLWVNGKPYGKVVGANRHQDFAVIGNAVPNNLQWRDACKLKDAGCRIVRSAHYVLDPAFMDACDELGLFVTVATPGWQFWNKEECFAERVYDDIRNMIRQNRNRPSIFLWEPILNETSYPAEFAKNAAAICEEEFPSVPASCDDAADGDEYFPVLLRPTRNLVPGKTYLIREWGDNVDDWSAQNSDSRVSRTWGEVPMLVQALHYEDGYRWVCSSAPQVVGGCLWHPFDFNRGYAPDPFFGGLMDLYRQPKTSYYMFMSQRPVTKYDFNAESGPMVYIAHEMTLFSPKDVTVFSNCDEVRLTVFKNGRVYTQKKKQTEDLPSPHFTFKGVYDFMDVKRLARAGKQDEYYILAEGLVDGKVVATDRRSPAQRPVRLRLRLDDNGVNTVADGSDIVTVIAEVVDKEGVVRRLNHYEVVFGIEGEGRLIGATEGRMDWGSAPVLVQSTTTPGKVRVTASVKFDGQHQPLSGEIVFETVPNRKKELYSESESKVMNIGGTGIVSGSPVSSESELRKENDRLRRLLNEYLTKETGEQQTRFGVGLND